MNCDNFYKVFITFEGGGVSSYFVYIPEEIISTNDKYQIIEHIRTDLNLWNPESVDVQTMKDIHWTKMLNLPDDVIMLFRLEYEFLIKDLQERLQFLHNLEQKNHQFELKTSENGL